MIGTTIGHYTIEEKLGEGGMGVVYKRQSRRRADLRRVDATLSVPPKGGSRNERTS